MGSRKPIALGLTILLIVGVAIGLIVGVRHVNNSNSKSGVVPSTSSKAVSAICSHTDYKQTCVDSLSSLTDNKTATPKDFLALAINVTIEAVKTGIADEIVGTNES
ncbi:hypothetical protein Nepgr_030454 [Nepenthes gracilis]|uniref:Pectinesterase inhibitor domain-containing protein n=1 Tax=Nepenthes gracilis TaxID=150966 RepID=A0AAD3TGR2_NEPGR|nr:hypothetical protein Nepgr_030454 [Nepenthes gracilis]